MKLLVLEMVFAAKWVQEFLLDYCLALVARSVGFGAFGFLFQGILSLMEQLLFLFLQVQVVKRRMKEKQWPENVMLLCLLPPFLSD